MVVFRKKDGKEVPCLWNDKTGKRSSASPEGALRYAKVPFFTKPRFQFLQWKTAATPGQGKAPRHFAQIRRRISTFGANHLQMRITRGCRTP